MSANEPKRTSVWSHVGGFSSLWHPDPAEILRHTIHCVVSKHHRLAELGDSKIGVATQEFDEGGLGLVGPTGPRQGIRQMSVEPPGIRSLMQAAAVHLDRFVVLLAADEIR
jgi:hypothetical protein